MNLIRFLFIGTFLSLVLGELGRYPFGSSSSGSVTVMDLFLFSTLIFYLIWIVVNRVNLDISTSGKWLVGFWFIGFMSLVASLIWIPLGSVLTGGLYLSRFVVYSSVFFISRSFSSTQLSFIRLSNLLTKIGFIIGVLGVLQFIFIPNFETAPFYLSSFGFDPHQNRLTSTFLDPNFVGVFLVLIFSLVSLKIIENKGKLAWYLLWVFMLLNIVLTYSRSAFLMLVIFLLVSVYVNLNFFILRKNLAKTVAVIGLFCLILVVSPRYTSRLIGGLKIDESAGERLESWSNGIEIFITKPVLGVGFNNLRYSLDNLKLFKPYSADGGHSGGGVDSSLLFVLSTTGLIGMFFYLGFWVSCIKKIRSTSNMSVKLISSSMVALLLSSFFVNDLFYPPIMLTYFALLGAMDDK